MAIPIYVTPDDLIPGMDAEPSELVALLAGLAALHDDDPMERADFIAQFADQAKAQSCGRILSEFLFDLLAAVDARGGSDGAAET